jgi:hypothetical protein
MRGFHVHRDDSFPYAMNTNQYWSGFYSTRPQFKRLVKFTSTRFHSSLMMSSLEAIKKDSPHMLFVINQQAKILDQLGTIQHHDSITGTSIRELLKTIFCELRKLSTTQNIWTPKSWAHTCNNISISLFRSSIPPFLQEKCTIKPILHISWQRNSLWLFRTLLGRYIKESLR